MRFHLFEFEDLAWFPQTIRQGGTDYLRYFLNLTDFYRPSEKILLDLLSKSGETNIIDLCSGGGGSIEKLMKGLRRSEPAARALLTDKFPNTDAFAFISGRSEGTIGYTASPVDATKVPPELPGVRTMYSAIHHFKPDAVKDILKDAVSHNAPIAIFDGGDKHIFTILGIIFVQPITFLLWTPFFRPFKITRLLLTYLLPLIPLMTMWDGIVSILRLYSPTELKKLALEADPENYHWESGRKRNGVGMHVTYLVGMKK